MEIETVRARLTPVFRRVFEAPELELFDAMTAADVEGWTSLTHVDLIRAAEQEFNVKFKFKDIKGLANVGEFIALLARLT